MKNTKLPVYLLAIAFALAACRAKKVVQQPQTPETPPAPAQQVPPPPPPASPADNPGTPPAAPKPDYNFSSIQFEFNSGVLKTESYPALDKAALEMKKDPSVKFLLAGNSSAEGTDEHNMSLSVERANAVKTYLVNSGVSSDKLDVKGFGESKPVADNKTEAGRVLNRRVEISKQN